ncbi:hypothetical protein TNIN_71411 [Trichonephila inaurata madagascariensis]|uniref:Uncharacterized protein n=1 Tax=Trichonephila inaurata madagascariensis TaxID=2747483 RepID=A0A8X7BXP7_9ARAC|nr:hypothetical protein TNIN_71411 [Trichonephila inaurata madagascariensis]
MPAAHCNIANTNAFGIEIKVITTMDSSCKRYRMVFVNINCRTTYHICREIHLMRLVQTVPVSFSLQRPLVVDLVSISYWFANSTRSIPSRINSVLYI